MIGSRSGAYIFMPAVGNQTSIRYCSLETIESFETSFMTEIHMTFTNDNSTQNATVRARFYLTEALSEWDVLLYGIPKT